MSKFEVGDRAIFIDRNKYNKGVLTYGKEYVVLEYSDIHHYMIRVIDDNGNKNNWWAETLFLRGPTTGLEKLIYGL